MTRRHLSVGIVLALSAVIGLTPAAARPAADPPPVRIFDVTTAHGIVDNRPDRPARRFTPDDRAVYVWFRAAGCTIGTTITSVWYYVVDDVPLRIREGSVTVDVVDDWGQFNLALGAGRRWPTGEYRVELRVRDQLLAETTFQVEDDR